MRPCGCGARGRHRAACLRAQAEAQRVPSGEYLALFGLAMPVEEDARVAPWAVALCARGGRRVARAPIVEASSAARDAFDGSASFHPTALAPVVEASPLPSPDVSAEIVELLARIGELELALAGSRDALRVLDEGAQAVVLERDQALAELERLNTEERRLFRARGHAWLTRRAEPAIEPAPDTEREPVATAMPPRRRAARRDSAPPPVAEARPAIVAPVRHDPGASPVRLVVLQVAELTSREDRFRCPPFSAVITSGTCLDRQKIATAHVEGRGSVAIGLRIDSAKFSRCANCATGRDVRARVEPAEAAE